MRVRALVVAALVGLVALAGGCRSGTAAGDLDPTTTAKAEPVTLTVFAAASLTEVFTEVGARFEMVDPGVTVRFNFGASSALARQVLNGAPADVLVTADDVSLDIAGSAGLLGPKRTFAINRLAIAVPRANPGGIRSLADLARPGSVVVLCAVEVPCGRLARSALELAGVELTPASLEPDVKAVVARVAMGEAHAGIAYLTDVMHRSESGVDGVAIPETHNQVTRYPAAVVDRPGAPDGSVPSPGERVRRAAAQGFVDDLVASDTLRLLESFGFGPP